MNSLPLAGSFARGGDRSAVHLDELIRQGEADAEPPVRAIDRPIDLDEEVEDARQHLGGDTDAVVFDRDDDTRRLAAAASVMCPPSSVYLAALVSRFTSTCSIRVGSAKSLIGPDGMDSVSLCSRRRSAAARTRRPA